MRELWDNLTWQQLGLIAFVFTTAGTVGVLLFDLWLYLTGRTMITEYSRANPWLAWILLTLVQFGVIGLAVHFMAQVKVDLDLERQHYEERHQW